MLGQMFDGIQRPLERIKWECNDSIYIPRGIEVDVLPRFEDKGCTVPKLWSYVSGYDGKSWKVSSLLVHEDLNTGW